MSGFASGLRNAPSTIAKNDLSQPAGAFFKPKRCSGTFLDLPAEASLPADASLSAEAGRKNARERRKAFEIRKNARERRKVFEILK